MSDSQQAPDQASPEKCLEPEPAPDLSLAKTLREVGDETPSIWDHKPWWCQPWSIVATGIAVVGVSWWLLHRWWISSPLALAIGVWWWLFLVAVPSAYQQEVQDGRSNP